MMGRRMMSETRGSAAVSDPMLRLARLSRPPVNKGSSALSVQPDELNLCKLLNWLAFLAPSANRNGAALGLC